MEKTITATKKTLITPVGLCHFVALASVMIAQRSDQWLPGAMVMVTAFAYQSLATFLVKAPDKTQSLCLENDLAAIIFVVGTLIAIKPYPGIGITMVSILLYQRIWSIYQKKSAESPEPLLPDVIKIFSDFRTGIFSSWIFSGISQRQERMSGFGAWQFDRRGALYSLSMLITFLFLLRS